MVTWCSAPTRLCRQIWTAQGAQTAASASMSTPSHVPWRPDTASHTWAAQETAVTMATSRACWPGRWAWTRRARSRPAAVVLPAGAGVRLVAATAAALGMAGGFLLVGVGGNVQDRAAVEEALRPQLEADGVHGHDGPVLHPGEVGQAEGVPHHDVLAVDVPVLRDIGGQARAAGVLVHEVARGVLLVLGVPGDPQVLGGKGGAAGDGGVRVREQRGLVVGVQFIAHGLPQPVAGFRVGHDPGPAGAGVGLPDAVGFAGQDSALAGEGV